MPYLAVNLQNIPWDSLIKGGQSGNGQFIGMPRQRGGMRGRGIGGILASVLSMLPTFLKSTVGQEIVSTGKNIVKDVVAGENVGKAVRKNGRQAVRNLTGLGKRKRKNPIGVLHSKPRSSGKRSLLLRDAPNN